MGWAQIAFWPRRSGRSRWALLTLRSSLTRRAGRSSFTLRSGVTSRPGWAQIAFWPRRSGRSRWALLTLRSGLTRRAGRSNFAFRSGLTLRSGVTFRPGWARIAFCPRRSGRSRWALLTLRSRLTLPSLSALATRQQKAQQRDS